MTASATTSDSAPAGDPSPAGTPTGPSAPTAWWTRWVGPGLRLYWLWPALVTFAFGLRKLGSPALWADELATWGAVRQSWPGLWRLLNHTDAVVGPYYALLKVWTTVAGTGDVALRLPSVAAMTVTATLVAVLGARLAAVHPDLGEAPGATPPRVGRTGPAAPARWVGLLAGLLFAVVPATSRYGQEARPYAFVCLAAVLATLVLTGLLARPGPGPAFGYGASLVLVAAFHLIALLIVAGHAVAVGYRWWRGPAPDRRAVLWSALAGTALALPVGATLAWYGHRQAAQVSWIPKPSARALLSAPDTILAAGTTAGAVLLLAALTLVRHRPGQAGRAVAVLAGWALGPPLLLFLVAYLTPLFWARYLVYTGAAWVLLAALTLARLRPMAALGLLAAIAVLAYPAQHAVRTHDGHNHATADAGGIITANERPGDGIVYARDEQPEPWEARDLVARYVPAARTPTDVFALAPQRTGGRLTAPECPDLAACLTRADPPRLWTIRFGNLGDPFYQLGSDREALLRSRYRLEHLWLVRGLTVALLVRI